jgi:hypothetical protein
MISAVYSFCKLKSLLKLKIEFNFIENNSKSQIFEKRRKNLRKKEFSNYFKLLLNN